MTDYQSELAKLGPSPDAAWRVIKGVEWIEMSYASYWRSRCALAERELEKTCEWSPIEEGSHCYNTCVPGEEFWLEDAACETWPHCHWCGGKVVVKEFEHD